MASEAFLNLEATQDASCRIESRGVSESGTPFIIYQTEAGSRWRIDGQCNQCGECWVGSLHPDTLHWTGTPVGQPGAFVDLRPQQDRLDCPVRPEIAEDCPSCTLTGEML